MDPRAILTPINVAVSIAMYYPLFRRILVRRSTSDFSITTQFCVVFLQGSSLVVAIFESARFLLAYYIVQLLLTSLVLWLIWKYRDVGSARNDGGTDGHFEAKSHQDAPAAE